MKYTKEILILSLVIIQDICCHSPYLCEDFSQYVLDGDRKTAIITIPGPGLGITNVTVFITISGTCDFETGKLETLKNFEEAVNEGVKGNDIDYKFTFPITEKWPIITRININLKDICESPQDRSSYDFILDYGHTIINPMGATELSNIPYRKPKRNIPSSSFLTDFNEKSHLPKLPNIPKFVTKSISSIHIQNSDHFTTSQPTTTPRLSTPSSMIYSPRIPRSTTTFLSASTNEAQFTTTPWSTTKLWPKVLFQPDDPTKKSLPYSEICGRRENFLQATHLIIGGEEVIPGEFPWMVALYYMEKREYKYKCAGSLISDRHVLTAAHCLQNQSIIYLEIGRYNIMDETEKEFEGRYCTNFNIHPDYEEEPNNDIGIILIDPVKFTPKIKPICLWGLNEDLKSGIVTGWGRKKNYGEHSSVPLKITVNKIDHKVCKESNKILNNMVTEKTFCAGGKQKGPCHGDSGSGFYEHDKEVWFLRGIVSSSVGDEFVCHVDKYAVYVDVVHFLDWIKLYLMI